MTAMAMFVRFALAALLFAGLATPASAAEQILSFDSTVVVRSDGALDVTETIKVKAEGNEIRRGIYRDFPLTFEDDDGTVHRVTFDVVSVRRDGVPEAYHTNTNREGIRIYMGEENTFLSPGTYTYQLKYTTARQIRFSPAGDHFETSPVSGATPSCRGPRHDGHSPAEAAGGTAASAIVNVPMRNERILVEPSLPRWYYGLRERMLSPRRGQRCKNWVNLRRKEG